MKHLTYQTQLLKMLADFIEKTIPDKIPCEADTLSRKENGNELCSPKQSYILLCPIDFNGLRRQSFLLLALSCCLGTSQSLTIGFEEYVIIFCPAAVFPKSRFTAGNLYLPRGEGNALYTCQAGLLKHVSKFQNQLPY